MSISKNNSVYHPTGAFACYGGWVLDTQFIPNIGSSYLLAHGLGNPVADASAKLDVPAAGSYRVWAYTKDWVANWKQGVAPGLFKLCVNGNQTPILGNQGKDWAWQDGGVFELTKGGNTIALCDLTGYEGRCAAVFATSELDFVPPSDYKGFVGLREDLYEESTEDLGSFDFAVAGGGIAGMCAAITAANRGVKVALIQDRYILGGNNSSEGRVWLGGETNFAPYEHLGDVTRSFEPEKHFHYGPENTAEIYEDEKRIEMITSNPNISLFTGLSVWEAEVSNGVIKSVTCIDVATHQKKKLSANLFADCTGDATLGFLAGADYEISNNGHMGMTNFWSVADTGEETAFAPCPWAIDLSNSNFPGRVAEGAEPDHKKLGGWYWESGMEHHPIDMAEYARDTNFRAMYGAFDALKNHGTVYRNFKLNHSSYIGGKRESRRLMGDVILTKSEVQTLHEYEDGCVPTTWKVDVHYPNRSYYPSFHEGDAFITTAYYEQFPYTMYLVPYRCFYSRNVGNLYMAGRNTSVSHDALGTVRVMRTGGMMGEVVGRAAAICKKHSCKPRDIYKAHLNELLNSLKSE